MTRRPLRALIGALACALVVPLAALLPADATAPSPALARTPKLPLTPVFAPAIESYAAYSGQTVCDPVSKLGTRKLAALLTATYGAYDIGITRSCADGGQSEHKEGRALDWMVSVKNSVSRAAATDFLGWLLAPDAKGNPAAMARRLGVMYIGWNNQMWRPYEPRGWGDLKGCSTTPSMQSASYDTYCHRNHVHISLTWDGAAGRSSFWTNRVLTIPDCASSAPAVAILPGSASAPSTLLDTARGVSTPDAVPCRVGARRWTGDDRTLRLHLETTPPATGRVNALRVRVVSYTSNSPGRLTIRGSAAQSVVPAQPAKNLVVPLTSSGNVAVAVTAGQGSIVLQGMGLTSVAAVTPTPPPPPVPTLRVTTTATAPTRVGLARAFVLAGALKVTGGKATNVTVRRELKVGVAWAARGTAVKVTGTAWRISATAPSKPTRLVYRIRVFSGTRVVATSAALGISVLKLPVVSVRAPLTVVHSRTFLLTGAVSGVPTGAAVRRYLRVGGSWSLRGTPVLVTTSTWRMSVAAPSRRQVLVYRFVVTTAGRTAATSRTVTVTVV